MRRLLLISSLVLLPVACSKSEEQPDVALPQVPLTAISATSTVLFSVYGPKDDPRIAPIGIANGGRVSPITLDEPGWQLLDSLFFQPGRKLPLYRDGAQVGEVEVVRGMWDPNEGTLYALPGCRLLVPQAKGRLLGGMRAEASIEFLSSTTPLTQSREAREAPRDPSAQGRTLANTIAASAQVGSEELSSLEFIARWLRTGAGATGHTLLASYIDPEAGDAGPGAGHSTMLLALAEDSAGSLASSYQHVSTGEARTVEMQRLVNHADLDGDGVDEILLESWKYAATPEVAVLKYVQGRWRPVFRVSQEWCLDAKPAP